ncbi:MAG: hypothetical protein J0J10_26320 [Bosea sp.]|uniref:hypothetical protein n=1 Tax=Bosea sp. (in: a-proteobacteria) TaxID=1871050 RepID=UPI001ACF400B|nr:hypothetical protein [Bosea sp. (in: a-proteobacteria)]MBN9472281.1 hypothetical protein [Bosea sp. (in: a-proteobacteria)]
MTASSDEQLDRDLIEAARKSLRDLNQRISVLAHRGVEVDVNVLSIQRMANGMECREAILSASFKKLM